MPDLKLYDWQVDDVEKLLNQTGAAIGSEMGTGKTLEAIILMEQWYTQRQARWPDLVVAPLNTHDGWMDKYERLSPDTDIIRINRKNRDAFLEAIEKRRGDVFLMHWDAIRFMKGLQKIQFGTIVADEAHRMANRKNIWTRELKKIPAYHKLAMSGTLSGDAPHGLWSPLNWLFPRKYTSFWAFYKQYVEDEIIYPQGFRKVKGPKNVEKLHAELEPFWVRHLKKEQCCAAHPNGAMPWLKEKHYDTIWVDLSPTQRRVYEEMRKHMVAWVGEHEDSPLVAQVAVAQMVRLSQMALATPYIDPTDSVVRLELPSSKADAIVEKLSDNPHSKFVVATSSKKFAYLLASHLADKKINATVLSGDTPDSVRHGQVARFEHDDNQAFIGVIAAMNEGIDGLQHNCSTMIFADRDWSSVKNKQCEDRLDRDGQKAAVQIIDVMARNTVDLGRHQKLVQKWSWIKALLDGKVSQTEEVQE
jgi:SNF2 family DNA or RNA helicase